MRRLPPFSSGEGPGAGEPRVAILANGRGLTPTPPPTERGLKERRVAEAAGRRGERLAGWWLRLKGWQILDRRVRTPAGEVDIVAKRGRLVAFVEVKSRATAAELDFAIDERRLARVAAAAEYLMPRYAQPGDDIRVDVLLLAPGVRPRHIENAWMP